MGCNCRDEAGMGRPIFQGTQPQLAFPVGLKGNPGNSVVFPPLPGPFLDSMIAERARTGDLLQLALRTDTPCEDVREASATTFAAQQAFASHLADQLHARRGDVPSPSDQSWRVRIPSGTGGGSSGPQVRVVKDPPITVYDGGNGDLGFTTQVAISGAGDSPWIVQEVKWWEYGLLLDCNTVTWEHGYFKEAFRTDGKGNMLLSGHGFDPREGNVKTNAAGETEANTELFYYDTHGAGVSLKNPEDPDFCQLCLYFHIRLVRFWLNCAPVQKFASDVAWAKLRVEAIGDGCLFRTKPTEGSMAGGLCPGTAYAYAILFYWNICPCGLNMMGWPEPLDPPPPPPPSGPTTPPGTSPPPAPPTTPPATTPAERRKARRRPVVVTAPAGHLGGLPFSSGAPSGPVQPVEPKFPRGTQPTDPVPPGFFPPMGPLPPPGTPPTSFPYPEGSKPPFAPTTPAPGTSRPGGAIPPGTPHR